jgi:hypothetical protein
MQRENHHLDEDGLLIDEFYFHVREIEVEEGG